MSISPFLNQHLKPDLFIQLLSVIIIIQWCFAFYCFCYQNVEAEKFETTPILFGDFMKMGADPADRIYEDLVDITKVKTLLTDVR